MISLLRRIKVAHLAIAALAALAVAFFPSAALAQLPNFSNTVSQLGTQFGPMIRAGMQLMGVACVLFAIWEFFQASRGGEPMGYVKGVGLIVVGCVLFAPITILGIFMSPAMRTALTAWGF